MDGLVYPRDAHVTLIAHEIITMTLVNTHFKHHHALSMRYDVRYFLLVDYIGGLIITDDTCCMKISL